LKNISLLSQIPEDTRFVFKTVAGKIIPREILTIPIFAGQEIRAIISMGTLKGFNPDHMEIITMVRPGMDTALASMCYWQETRQLAETLREKNKALGRQARKLEMQANELEARNLELGMQKRELEAASRLKSQFLSNMSHELRTPLNSVLALSRILKTRSENRLSEEEQNYLAVIERNGRQLLKLINDLLDLSKIEAGGYKIRPAPFSPVQTIEHICDRIAPLAQEKGLYLRKALPEDLPLVYGDEARVGQILENLMVNAVKFTDKGGITVTAECSSSNIFINIADTGIGIASSDISLIFDEFQQVDGSAARKYSGTGLGLAIARKTASMLGGKITVDSQPGKGSKFTLILPLKWRQGEDQSKAVADNLNKTRRQSGSGK
jgi:signal transduction histidine kinase